MRISREEWCLLIRGKITVKLNNYTHDAAKDIVRKTVERRQELDELLIPALADLFSQEQGDSVNFRQLKRDVETTLGGMKVSHIECKTQGENPQIVMELEGVRDEKFIFELNNGKYKLAAQKLKLDIEQLEWKHDFPTEANFSERAHPAIFTFRSSDTAKKIYQQLIRSGRQDMELDEDQIKITPIGCENGRVLHLLKQFRYSLPFTMNAARYLAQQAQDIREYKRPLWGSTFSFFGKRVARTQRCQQAWQAILPKQRHNDGVQQAKDLMDIPIVKHWHQVR